MDILTRIRNTTPESLEGTRSDFDDDTPYIVRSPRKDKGMTRIVEGATDLERPAIPNLNPGTSVARDWSGEDTPARNFAHDGEYCDDRRCCPEAAGDRTGLPTEPQMRFINSLLSDLMTLDLPLWREATAYTTKMTDHRAWTPGRGGNTSRWINNLKTKIAELRNTRPVAETSTQAPELPVKLDKSGKPMPLYYAVGPEGETKFYRIKPGRKPGFYFIDVQASDDFHQIRNFGTKASIIRSIVAAGPDACMKRYGREIGSCGRCGRTLTDELSRSRGIGPDCWGKM